MDQLQPLTLICEFTDGQTKHVSVDPGLFGQREWIPSRTYPAPTHPKLRKVIFPEGITEIGNQFFLADKDLEEVVLPESLEVIHHGAFKECTALKQIRIPNNVTEIRSKAFFG